MAQASICFKVSPGYHFKVSPGYLHGGVFFWGGGFAPGAGKACVGVGVGDFSPVVGQPK